MKPGCSLEIEVIAILDLLLVGCRPARLEFTNERQFGRPESGIYNIKMNVFFWQQLVPAPPSYEDIVVIRLYCCIEISVTMVPRFRIRLVAWYGTSCRVPTRIFASSCHWHRFAKHRRVILLHPSPQNRIDCTTWWLFVAAHLDQVASQPA